MCIRDRLEKARALAASAKSCEDIERANVANGNSRPADPGELRVDAIGVPALRQLVAEQALGKASQPLIAEDGIAAVSYTHLDVYKRQTYIKIGGGPLALNGGQLWLRQADRELDPQGVALLHAGSVVCLLYTSRCV